MNDFADVIEILHDYNQVSLLWSMISFIFLKQLLPLYKYSPFLVYNALHYAFNKICSF